MLPQSFSQQELFVRKRNTITKTKERITSHVLNLRVSLKEGRHHEAIVMLLPLAGSSRLVHAHGGDGGKNGKNEMCARQYSAPIDPIDRSIDSLQLAV
jgi:hypothetical protein